MLFSKCLLAVFFYVALVRSQGRVEGQSESTLLVAMFTNDTGHVITEVTQDHDIAGSCETAMPSVEVHSKTSSCGGRNSNYHIKLTITTTPHPNGLPATPPTSTTPLTTSPTTPSVTTPPPCILPGYSRIADLGCYKFQGIAVLWQQAKEACEKEGGSHLVIINSEAEATAIANLTKQNGLSYTWVGIRESNTTQHQFFTIFGEPLSSTGFSRWATGDPDKITSLGNPVSLSTRDVALDEEAVHHTTAFVCEQLMC